ncbi:MAG: hypothetical protein U0791_24125 [Gemmataceae bacterium]
MTPLLKPKRRRRFRSDRRTRALTFSTLAWLKFQFLCHAGPTEVGGFALSHPDEPLFIEDVLVVRQHCTFVSVAFDDAAVADLFEDMADAGITPNRFARIWLHTHPGASVEPSGVDETTFARVFGACDWSVMAILGRTGRMSARLQFTTGPGATIALPTRVDWSDWPDLAGSLAERVEAWRQDYVAKIHVPRPSDELLRTPSNGSHPRPLDTLDDFPGDWHAFP